MTDIDRVYSLIARKLSGEATPDEIAALEQAIKDHPDLGFYLEIMTSWWNIQPLENIEQKQAAAERLMERLKEPAIQQAYRKKPVKKFEWYFSFINAIHMFKNFFTISHRVLARNRVFSFINITGLAIGMASAALIILWIQNELSFDQFHEKKDRIYEVYNKAEVDGKIECWNSTPQVLAPTLSSGYPQIEKAIRMNWVGAFVFHTGEKHMETQGFITDPEFLTMFDFPMLEGDPKTALSDVHSLVLTEKMAKRMFGNENAMGKTVRIDSIATFTVTGVMKDLPNNTRFEFQYLVPWNYMKEVHWDRYNWEESSIQTYVLLKPGASEATADASIAKVPQLHSDKIKNEIFLHPMRKWRLWSNFENGKIVGGRIETVRLFGVIAGFILLIACINYMNMSTARSEKRGKEVGIRKVLGAHKSSLIGQFLAESVFFAFLAGAIALLIVIYAIPWFNKLTYKELFIPYTNPYFWLSATGFMLLTGVIAGSYPAFYLSDFKPIKAIKGHFKISNAVLRPRKVLVVLQFSFAIALIICTIIIYQQIKYVQQRDAGFGKENLAFTFAKGNVLKDYSLISAELLKTGAITSITRTNSPITTGWNTDGSYEWAGKDPNAKMGFTKIHADNDFARTMGLTLLAGRDINIQQYPTDSTAVLLNESAAKLMNFSDPVGQQIKSDEGTWHVVGVVKNFILGMPFERVEPMIIQGPGIHHWFGTVTFRLNSHKTIADNLAKIEGVFKKYNPDYPFECYFADTEYAAKFGDQQRTARLATVFAGLTIFISCLGLFALATYTAESRIKEIGVRKVLGASVIRITTLLSTDFLKLVLISFVIASPVAWWCMHNWLQDYAYRINISWWIFVFTGLLSVMIAILTISYQAIRAATADPVIALRND